MKKNISVFLLLAITSTAFGVIFGEFKSWSDLTDYSSSIIIAKCTATPDFIPSGISPKMTLNIDGRTESNIEVLDVLKGDAKSSLSKLVSFYKPYQGEIFLVFSDYSSSGTNSYYVATEEYRVIPLGRNFHTNSIIGRPLDEQLQILFKRRIEVLNEEIQNDATEKERLEQGLKK